MRRLVPIVCCISIIGALAVGACADDPDPGPARVLAKTPRGAVALTLGDDERLYYSEFDLRGDNIGDGIGTGDEIGGSLWRLDPRSGGAKKFSGRNASAIVVREGYAYFADPIGSAGAVGRVATSGGDPELYTSYNGPVDVAVDDDFVYWIEQGNGGGVLRAPREGGETERLSKSDDVWGNLVLSGDDLYWITLTGVARMPKDGGAVEPILEADDWKCCLPARPTNLAIAGDFIYLAASILDGGGLARMKLDGSKLRSLLDDQPNASSITVAGGYLYWARGNDNRYTDAGEVEVMRMKLDGGKPERLASKQNGISGIVATDEHIYWLNTFTGTLVQVATADLAH